MRRLVRAGGALPVPLLVLFGAFLVAMAYLIAVSITRRSAPVFAASPLERTRAPNWQRVGDTLTIDATNGDVWRYVSLTRGRVLTQPDTAGWELAVQRYRVILPVPFIDLGAGPFDSAEERTGGTVVLSTSGAPRLPFSLGHWYRYNLLTHLLEPSGHVYALRAHDRIHAYKVEILGYYCPGLVAGCLTVRYAPLVPRG